MWGRKWKLTWTFRGMNFAGDMVPHRSSVSAPETEEAELVDINLPTRNPPANCLSQRVALDPLGFAEGGCEIGSSTLRSQCGLSLGETQ